MKSIVENIFQKKMSREIFKILSTCLTEIVVETAIVASRKNVRQILFESELFLGISGAG